MPSSCLSNQLHAKKREFPPVEVSSADETLAPQHAGVAVPVPAQTPAPVKPTQPKASPSSTPHGRSHGLRTGAARGTRSGNQETVHAFEWEEVDLAKSRSSPIRPEVVITVRPSPGSKQANVLTHLTPKMSRNRPRAPRDNGIAATEETELWTKIVGDMKLAQEKNDRQKVLGEQIKSLNEKVGKEGSKLVILCREMVG